MASPESSSNGRAPDLALFQTRHAIASEFAWNYSQVSALKRALAAKAVGLDPAQFGQLPPGSNVTVIYGSDAPAAPPEGATATPPPATAPAAASPLKTAATYLALLAGGGLGAAGLTQWLKPTPAVVATNPAAAQPAQDVNELVEQRLNPATGQWEDVRTIGQVAKPKGNP